MYKVPRKKTVKAPSEQTIKILLQKHGCPIQFHEVRTRFLGNIATPALSVSPLGVVEDLWGGALPVFDDIDEANALVGTLVQGLWNDLTRHQKRSQPFRLRRVVMEPTSANLSRYAQIRRQELDGFIDGLFNGEDAIDLPGQAHEAIGHLAELRAMMAGICDLVEREPSADEAQLDTTFKRLRELTRIMETEIHATVLSCTRARRQMIESVITEKPTVH